MDVDFDPGFITKATWHKMRPHFIAEEDQVRYCKRISINSKFLCVIFLLIVSSLHSRIF